MIRTTIMSVTAAIAFAGVASADVTRTIDVRFADFSNPEHADLIYADIREVAEEACVSVNPRSVSVVTGPQTAKSYRRMIASCVNEAVETTLETADVPQLDERHSAFIAGAH